MPTKTSAADRAQVEVEASTEPNCAVAVIPQLVFGVGMHEHVERAVIEREPADDLREVRRCDRELVAPARMRTDVAFVKTSHADPVSEVRDDRLPEVPRPVAARRVEIHVRVPAADARDIEMAHPLILSSVM